MNFLLRSLPILLAVSLISAKGGAQIDRSQPPKAGPPPEVKLGEHHSFELENGLKVFVVEEHSLPVLSFYLMLDHDPVLEGEKKGYVDLTGSMLDKGTEKRSKEEIAEEVDGMGATLRPSGNSIFARSLRKHSDKLLDIMGDVLLNPTFPEEELEKLKKRQKSSIQQQKSQPAAIRENVRKAVTYGKDHPYGEVKTQESIDRIQVEDLKEHYDNYWAPESSYLAVVGNVEPEKAEQMVREAFSDWEPSEAPSHEYEFPGLPEENQVALADKDNAVQSELRFAYPLELEPGSEEAMPAELMNSVLGGGGFSSRLLKNIREDKGYTYSVSSRVGSDPLVGEFLAGGSVATNVTDSAITEFIKEMEKLKKDGVTEEELRDHKDRMGGGFTLRLEDPQTIARYAINIERYDLPEDHYRNYLKRLDKISKEEVDRAADKYIKPDRSNIVVVGDEDSLSEQLKKFGPVQRYDEYGFEKGEKKKVDVSADLTPEKVLKDFEKAVGGKKELAKVEDVRRVYKGSVRGQTLVMESLYKHEKPGFFGSLFGKEAKHMTASSMEIPGMMTLQESVFDGTNAYVKTRGELDTLTGEELKAKKRSAGLYAQRNYLDNGYELKVLKGAEVRGEKAVVLQVTDPSGEVSEEYYSLESGLLLKEVSEQEGPQGKKVSSTMNYMDYEDFNGVKFPNTLKIEGQQTIELNRDKLQINQGIPDEDFQL